MLPLVGQARILHNKPPLDTIQLSFGFGEIKSDNEGFTIFGLPLKNALGDMNVVFFRLGYVLMLPERTTDILVIVDVIKNELILIVDKETQVGEDADGGCLLFA